MHGLIKLACPHCEAVVFECETSDLKRCLSCTRTAHFDAWKLAGMMSTKRPPFWVALMAINAHNQRLAEEAEERARPKLDSYGGGFSF